jgi:diguanylate cyclase (GGDEF)-like protein
MDTLRQLLIELTAATAARRAVLWLAQPEQRRVALRAASRGVVVGDWLPLSGTPLNWLIEAGQPVRFEARPPISADAARVLAVPLPGRAGAVPIVTLEFDPNAIVPDADAVAPAIGEFTRNLAAVEERAGHEAYRAQVGLLIETLRRIPAAPGPEEFARDLAADVCRLVRADGAAIATWSEDSGRVLAAHGTEDGPAPGAVFGPGDSELALAARAATLLRRDLRERRVGPPHIVASDERWIRVPRHFAALPLMLDDQVTGLLAVWADEPLDEQGVDLLEILAPFAGGQLAKAVEFGRVRASAECDALTGLPNRRAFERAFEAERQRFLRYAHPVSLVIADVDHFKAVNDTHGHDAGDAVLRAFADTLAGCIRDVDTLARFGGEEFVVLLPETAVEAAAEAAERLRRATEAIQIPHDGEFITVRASFGVSTCPDCVPQPDGLLRSADASLYEAKREGRNRVRTAPRTRPATQPAGPRNR